MKNSIFVRLHCAVKNIVSNGKESIFEIQKIINIQPELLTEKRVKHHGIRQYFSWLFEQIKLYHQKEQRNIVKKWSIYFVDFGINIGSEINGIRPAIIFQRSRETYGSDIIVIPMSTKKEKKKDKFDVIIIPSSTNNLHKISIIKMRQIRCVSKKRLQKYIGTIENIETQNKIEKNMIRFFGINAQKTPPDKNQAGHTHPDKNRDGS